MSKLERNLKKLQKIRDWYWTIEEEDKTFRDYLNNKYEVFNKVCWVAEVFIEQGYDWEVDWLTSQVFLKVNEGLEDNFSIDKGLFARALLILEGDEDSLRNEQEFIDNYTKILNKED